MIKWISILFWGAVFIALVWFSIDRLPPQHNPFTPLSIDHPLGLGTSHKLSRFDDQTGECFAFLDDARIEYTRLPEAEPGEACGFYAALTLDQSALPYSAGLHMTCPLTSALAVWERQSLIPRAINTFEPPPVEVLSFGSYSCRRLYGRSSGRYSEHASGNAIDIEGIRLADGTRITVAEHWGENSQEGRLLKHLRDDACRIFGTVLGPDYNDAHADHFHFDMSQTGICS